MPDPNVSGEAGRNWLDVYGAVLRVPVMALAGLAGAALLAMMLVTCTDVVLRLFRISLTGAFDLVKIAGAVTIAGALPYTTAVKGHVAIEYFFHQLGRRGRIALDGVIRLLAIALFSALSWRSVQYGLDLRLKGEVSQTLQIPVYWIPWVVALSCALVVLVTLYHLMRPGQAMIKP